jgi:hypothetical protein
MGIQWRGTPWVSIHAKTKMKSWPPFAGGSALTVVKPSCRYQSKSTSDVEMGMHDRCHERPGDLNGYCAVE